MRLALVALLLLPLVAAQGSPDYGNYQYGDYGDYQGGCVDAVDFDGSDDDEVSYEYAYVCEGTVRAVDFSFEIGIESELSMEAALVEGANSNRPESVAAFDMTVGLIGVAVFEDTDGDGAFGPDDDALVEEAFSSGGWGAMQTRNQDGRVEFSATYDLDMGGEFKVLGSAQVAPYTVEGIRVLPGDTKIDFEFHDVPFPTESAKIALVLGISSEAATVKSGGPHGIQGREQGIAVGGAQSAYFAWAKTAKVDGVDRPVSAYEDVSFESDDIQQDGQTIHAHDAEGTISLAYPQGKDIVHDPRLGVAFSKSGGNGIPAPGLVVAPLLLAAAAMRRR